MQRWVYMLGGLLVWAVHFVGVYAIASLGDVITAAEDPIWRMTGLTFSIVCAGVAGGLLLHALRKADGNSDTVGLANTLARAGALLALISIIWQTLPTVIGY